jgi:T1SS-143 domain-containing protein
VTPKDTSAPHGDGAQKINIGSGQQIVTSMTEGQALVLASDAVEVQGMSMDKAGELIIQLSDGASVTIKNFADIAENGGHSFITLPSGQTINLAELIQTLAPAAQETQVADATPTQQALASEHTPAGAPVAPPADGHVIVIEKPHAHENVVVKLADGDHYKLDFSMTDPSSVKDTNGELTIAFKDGGEIIIPNYDAMKTAHLPDIALNDGTTLSVTDLGDTLAQAAQLTNVEPAAGGNGGGGGGGAHGGGFGFGSLFTADDFHSVNPVGPIGETELQYHIFDRNPQQFDVVHTHTVHAPALTVHDVSVYENEGEEGDGQQGGSDHVALVVQANMIDPGPSDHLVITISGIQSGWGVDTSASGGVYDAAHGTWTLILPPGENFTGVGPTVTPPSTNDADMDGLVVTATVTDGIHSASTTGTENVTIIPVADPVPITAPDDTGNQNTAIATPIALSVPFDPDGSEHITSIVISGVPADATLNHGTLQSNGTWLLTQGDLTGLTITPAQWFHGDIPLSVAVTDTETTASGHTASVVTTQDFTVHVLDTIIAPTVSAHDISITEDGNFAVNGGALQIAAALVNPSPTEQLTVTVSGIAAGWTVDTSHSGGTYDAVHGTWTITLAPGENFAGGPTVIPPSWTAADMDGLQVTATASDGTLTASSSTTENVTIVPIADPVPITAPDDTGNQNTAIATPITLTLPQGVTDGADHITSIVISGVPAGATLNHGAQQPDGTWVLSQNDLNGLTLTPPQWFHGDIPLSVQVNDNITTLSGHTDNALTTQTFTVHVLDTIIAPTVCAHDISITEDGNFAVNGGALQINAALVNPSPTEQLTVTVTGIAAGWTVDTSHSGGTYDAASGTWTVTLAPGENFTGGPTVTPPSWTAADMDGLQVTATASDGTLTATSATTENVTIVPIADPVPITSPDASGNENSTIPLSITLTLPQGVTDGADHITSIVISGVPAGATLNHGVQQPDGAWVLTQGDLTGLTITPTSHFIGTFPLSVQVVDTITTLSGHTDSATTNSTLNVDVLHQGPTIAVSGNTDATYEANLHPGPTSVSDAVTAQYFDGDTGAVTATGASSFAASGALANGVLTSEGSAVTVTETNNTYVGTANGHEVFSLTVQANGQYTFTLDQPLDQQNVNGQAAGPIDLAFGVTATDSDGYSASTVIHVLDYDDAPLAHPDVNTFDITAGGTTGNVITGVNGGAGAADQLSSDGTNTVTEIAFGGHEIAVPVSGNVTIDGAYGALTIDAAGDYTYTLFGAGGGGTTVSTPHTFTGNSFPTSLPEGVAIPPSVQADEGEIHSNMAINGTTVISGHVIGDGAGYTNSLGAFEIGPGGVLEAAQMLSPGITGAPGPQFNFNGVNGATEVGFFLVANGFNTNNGYSGMDFSHGQLSFVYDYGQADQRAATVNDAGSHVSLVFTEGNTSHVIQGPLYFTSDAGGSNTLNADGVVHTISGVGADSNTLVISFEDLPNGGDRDYNDTTFAVQMTDQTPATGPDQFQYTLSDDDGSTSTTTLSFNTTHTVLAPGVSAHDVSVTEDGAVALSVQANLNNPGPSDHLTVTISGFQPGWTVDTSHSGGTYDATTGTWTITLPNGVNFSGGPTVTPPAANDADMTGLIVTATQTDGTQSASSTATESVTIIPEADPIAISAHDSTGNENATIPVSIALTVPSDPDNSEHISSILISGVPAGATLNHGVQQTDGTWLLSQADLTGLTITPVKYFDGDIALTVTVTDTETTASGHSASAVTSAGLTVHVLDDAPVAHNDTNTFSLCSGEATGNVITGLNGGPGAADAPSPDAPNLISQVSFGNTVVDVPQTGEATIAGANGVLHIHADGSYTYDANPGAGTTLTTSLFNPDKDDVHRDITSLTKNGVTLSVDDTNGHGSMTWVDTGPDAPGIGVFGNGEKTSSEPGGVCTASFAQPAASATISLVDHASQNASDLMTFSIYLAGDPTHPVVVQEVLPANAVQGLTSFTFNAADYGGTAISKITFFSSSEIGGGHGEASFLVNNISYTSQTCHNTADVFHYTLTDAEGDSSSATLTLDGTAQQGTVCPPPTHTVCHGDGHDYEGGHCNTFQYQGCEGHTDTISSFNCDNSGGDRLDLHCILSGYDPLTCALSNFVKTTQQGSNCVVQVDCSGTGQHFQNLCTLEGVHTDVETLCKQGHLVV